ncbi:MAG TPA: hypothetical protein VIU86_08715, partial [Gaiellaceae bacterium]
MTATPSPQTPLSAPPVAIPPVPPVAGEGGRRLPRGGPIRVAVLAVLLTGVSLLFMYPFLWAISASLKPRNDVFDNRLIPKHFHPWNYVEVFKGVPDIAQGAPFGLWFWNSIWIGVAAAAAVTVSSALVAFAFAYFRFPLRNFLFGCVLGSMMLPGAVT